MNEGDIHLDPFGRMEPYSTTEKSMAFDLDLDLVASNSISQNHKPSRFQPKTRFQSKPKLEKAELKPNGHHITEQEDHGIENNGENVEPSHSYHIKMNDMIKEEVAEIDETENIMMDIDEEEEDRIVREIDVFFTPMLDTGSKIYLMQYPLRPCWRPYELNERCQEVRILPKESKVEIDLSVDVDSQNYDQEISQAMRIQKQTLSSCDASSTTGHAIGVLMGNTLHLNPVHAIVQLRPSMSLLNNSDMQKKNNSGFGAKASGAFDNVKETRMIHSKTMEEASKEQNTDKTGVWVSLDYHGIDSFHSSQYLKKMVTRESLSIPFSMSSCEYINCLCPRMPADSDKSKGTTMRSLLSLPLEERIKRCFSEKPQLHRFASLLHLAPDDSIDNVLKILNRYAELVQGLWISKSSLLYEGVQSVARDYVLLLFSKKKLIPYSELQTSKISNDVFKQVLKPFAIERSVMKDWKLKEPTDEIFIKAHPDIVEEKERSWSVREKRITSSVHGGGSRYNVSNRDPNPENALQGERRVAEGSLNKGMRTMSKETREALSEALLGLFQANKICSLQFIRQGLRDMPSSRISKAVAQAELAPSSELECVISEAAVSIHGVYVLRSLGNPTIDPLRNVVINLLRAKPPGAKLKKADVVEAVRIVLKREITNQEFTQVMTELCFSGRGGSGWMLKNGNGEQK